MSLTTAWPRKHPRTLPTAFGMRSDGNPTSRTSPEGLPRVAPGARPSGFPPMYTQSEGTTLQVVQASAVRLYTRFASPWLCATTSCFQVAPRFDSSFIAG